MDSSKPMKTTGLADGRMSIRDFDVDTDDVDTDDSKDDDGGAVKSDLNSAGTGEMLDDSVFDIGPGSFPSRRAQATVEASTRRI